MGIGKAVNTGFANNGILTIMSYWGEGTTFGQFMAYIIGIVVSFVGAAVLTYLVGFEDTAVKAAPAQSPPAQSAPAQSALPELTESIPPDNTIRESLVMSYEILIDDAGVRVHGMVRWRM